MHPDLRIQRHARCSPLHGHFAGDALINASGVPSPRVSFKAFSAASCVCQRLKPVTSGTLNIVEGVLQDMQGQKGV